AWEQGAPGDAQALAGRDEGALGRGGRRDRWRHAVGVHRRPALGGPHTGDVAGGPAGHGPGHLDAELGRAVGPSGTPGGRGPGEPGDREQGGAAERRRGEQEGACERGEEQHRPGSSTRGGARLRFRVPAVRRGQSTFTAVTMPNMPSSFSAWLRMWQCHTHTPGAEALNSTVYRSPGPTVTVSAKYGESSGMPSRATTSCGNWCRCIGWYV